MLHGIDLTLPEGSFTALVGPSGGGKSTVAKLIARFWDVSAGEITVGGVNVKDMPLSQLSEYVSFVTQDNFLFNCSLLENIRLGDLGATDEQVRGRRRAPRSARNSLKSSRRATTRLRARRASASPAAKAAHRHRCA